MSRLRDSTSPLPKNPNPFQRLWLPLVNVAADPPSAVVVAYNGDDTEEACPNPDNSKPKGLSLMEEDRACAWPSSSSVSSNR